MWINDNIEVLRGINSDCVDLIYLDPPFNSNVNYPIGRGQNRGEEGFRDIWTLDDINIYEHGEMADRDPGAYAVINAARAAHGKGMMAYLIMMALRLIEMHRVLRPSGSIYLHCDDTAGHYLKLLMDAIFGKDNYLNALTWRRAVAHNDAKRYGRIADYILFYKKSGDDPHTWNPVMESKSDEEIKESYPSTDSDGRRFRSDNITGAGAEGTESIEPWKNYDVASRGRHWAPPLRSQYADYIEQNFIPGYKSIQGVHARLDALDAAGLIHHPRRGFWPGLKRYAEADQGVAPQSIILKPIGITNFGRRTEVERWLRWPTRKPVDLLEKLIQNSSNPGDLIFDPFCGCATTLVAADRLNREWIGCDVSPLAGQLVRERIQEDQGGLLKKINVLPEDLPKRDDIRNVLHYKTNRHRLYGEQEGICTGCQEQFTFTVMVIDHKLPKSKGGGDDLENLHMMCFGCNAQKGDKTMAEWRAWQKKHDKLPPHLK